jgi:phosphohistidine phosphatase
MAQTFELYLIRHGLAADRGPEYADDGKRPLTAQGITKLKREACALVELDVAFDVILTSPLVRCRQTAEIFAATLRSKPAIVNTDALAPGGTFGALIDELGRHGRRERLALVGHEPDLGQLAARLLGAKRSLEFKKGAICRIDVAALPPTAPGHLRWYLTPRMLRIIGK